MDSRLVPANETVGWKGAEPKCNAPNLVEGSVMTVKDSCATIFSSPDGSRMRQLVYGSRFRVLEEKNNFSFGFSELDGYVGYIRSSSLLKEDENCTHWVSALGSHIYSKPDIKDSYFRSLSFGSRLAIESITGDFYEIVDGGYVPKAHLKKLGKFYSDPTNVAKKFLGVPYLWGGNSCWGIDCSGLVQAALVSCSINCPGDSDQQEKVFSPVKDRSSFTKNDLMFWKGHVAIIINSSSLIHANANSMSVAIEPILKVIERIKSNTGSDFSLYRWSKS